VDARFSICLGKAGSLNRVLMSPKRSCSYVDKGVSRSRLHSPTACVSNCVFNHHEKPYASVFCLVVRRVQVFELQMLPISLPIAFDVV